MNTRTRIAVAGNVFAPALAEVVAAGYAVTRTAQSAEWQARREGIELSADDPLSLLGLVRLYEARGKDWLPTDQEVDQLLELDAKGAVEDSRERVDVWEVAGAVHLLCITSSGDPVELSEIEAQAFASRLAAAIEAAKANDA